MDNNLYNMTGDDYPPNFDGYIPKKLEEKKQKESLGIDGLFWVVFFFVACFLAGYIVGSNDKEKLETLNKNLKSNVNYLESKLWKQKK